MKQPFQKVRELVHNLMNVRRVSGHPVSSQLVDIATGLLSDRKLGLMDYFVFRLYDRSAYGPANPAEHVVGWRAAREYFRALNADSWTIVADDKLLAESLLRDAGLPTPRVQAVYHPRGRRFGGAVSLRSVEDISHFLLGSATYPLFCKPNLGNGGSGALALSGYDLAARSVIDHLGAKLEVGALAKRIAPEHPAGRERAYIFQDKLRQLEAVSEIMGDGVCTLRVLVLTGKRGVDIARAAWRIIATDAAADNFHMGTSGNLVAGVDPSSGTVFRVVSGVGDSLRMVETHPRTGAPLLGIKVPQWQQVRELCLAAAEVFPMLQWQHWDVALTDQGPVLIELNCQGCPTLLQTANGSGLLDPAFRYFLNENSQH